MRNNLFLPWPEGALRRRKVLVALVFVHKVYEQHKLSYLIADLEDAAERGAAGKGDPVLLQAKLKAFLADLAAAGFDNTDLRDIANLSANRPDKFTTAIDDLFVYENLVTA